MKRMKTLISMMKTLKNFEFSFRKRGLEKKIRKLSKKTGYKNQKIKGKDKKGKAKSGRYYDEEIRRREKFEDEKN